MYILSRCWVGPIVRRSTLEVSCFLGGGGGGDVVVWVNQSKPFGGSLAPRPHPPPLPPSRRRYTGTRERGTAGGSSRKLRLVPRELSSSTVEPFYINTNPNTNTNSCIGSLLFCRTGKEKKRQKTQYRSITSSLFHPYVWRSASPELHTRKSISLSCLSSVSRPLATRAVHFPPC